MNTNAYFDLIANRPEYPGFIRNALSWVGSVTPKVILGTLISIVYSFVIVSFLNFYPEFSLEIGPFEYSSVALGLLLVFRVNAGYDRWWEARKLWGSIVNQSRNLAIVGLTYSSAPAQWREKFSSWVALLPHIMRQSLRAEKDVSVIQRLVKLESSDFENVLHRPSWGAIHIAKLLDEARMNRWMDDFSFHRAERERSILIDNIGACERILKTPIPFVVAIKLKRFLLIFLALLPFALFSRLGWWAIIFDALITYPLLSLDRIGYELQNPFERDRLSHLPLSEICANIEKNVLEIEILSRKS